jgi:hypothetical protein
VQAESISNRGLANEVNGLSFLCPQVEVAETEDANGLPILDQGRTVRISPRFEMLSIRVVTPKGHLRLSI